MRHHTNGLPYTVSQSVRGLHPNWGIDGIGLLVVDSAAGVTFQELLVEVATEFVGNAASVCTKLLKVFNDALGDKGFDAVEPGALGSLVHK